MTDGDQKSLKRHMDRWARIARLVPLLALILAATNSGMTGVLLKLNANRRHDQCVSIHRMNVVGVRIIDGRPHLRRMLNSGQISQAQYDDQVRATERALRLWQSADCPRPK
jgi:hypothetical protein